ncbi:MAG TPA: OadG family protein [Atribacterota bacterium]|nr:OadG family protein [Atribacterota bacterium]
MYEGIKGAILVSLISMTIVFIVLGLLALLMVGLRKIVAFFSNKTTKGIKISETTSKDLSQKEKTSVVTEERKSGEIVAVISAALSSYLSQTKTLRRVHVISIRRIMPLAINPWAISGIQNMIAKRLSFSNRIKGGF